MSKSVSEGVLVCCNACVSICLFSPTNKSFFSLNLSTQNRWHIIFNVKDIRYTIYFSFFHEIPHIQAVFFVCSFFFSFMLFCEMNWNIIAPSWIVWKNETKKTKMVSILRFTLKGQHWNTQILHSTEEDTFRCFCCSSHTALCLSFCQSFFVAIAPLNRQNCTAVRSNAHSKIYGCVSF